MKKLILRELILIQMKKFLTFIIIAILLISGSIAAYFYFFESGKRNPWSVIPKDAIFIIETSNLTKGWKSLSNSPIWEGLLSSPNFRDINHDAKSLDSLIKENSIIDGLLGNRRIIISAHMINQKDYDFLFVVDLKKLSAISELTEYITGMVNQYDYSLNEITIEHEKVLVLSNSKDQDKIYLSFVENLLVCSYSSDIIFKALSQRNDNFWINNPEFNEVVSSINEEKLFSFYFNYSILPDYLRCFTSKENDLVQLLSQALTYSSFNMNFDETLLTLNGSTNINDSNSSYIKALSKVKPGKSNGANIISDKTALYLSLCFDDFGEFYKNLINEFIAEDTSRFENYSKKVKRIEKLFNIHLQNDFFSWIGNEIAFIKLQPVANTREEDVVVAFHTKNIDHAQQGLERISKKVSKRSFVKINTVDYQNFQIRYFGINGFFKMFFGNLFKKLEKPYYTYIQDYVVFSNSPSVLMDFIDDYVKGNTLSNKKPFNNFSDRFDSRANIKVFIQMPKLYSHIYLYSNEAKRIGIQDNRNLILSFSRIGFQMVSSGTLFKTTLMAEHDNEAAFTEELEKIELATNEVSNTFFESLSFKIQLSDDELSSNTLLRLYHANNSLKAEGIISKNKLNGLWKSYDENGNIISSVNYKNGEVDGIAYFYYPNETSSVKSKITFEEDIIIGIYQEFYQNGVNKATITYKKGKPNGDAEFFYDSGLLMISGQFENGLKSGKWKHFTETGEVYDKEKWKNGKMEKAEGLDLQQNQSEN